MIYDYKCNHCDHKFEAMHKVSEKCDKCPNCEGHDITKLISTPPLMFKGDGFHSAGFHSKGNK